MNTPGDLLIASILPLPARTAAVPRPAPATRASKRITKVEDATTLVKAYLVHRLAPLTADLADIARRIEVFERRLA